MSHSKYSNCFSLLCEFRVHIYFLCTKYVKTISREIREFLNKRQESNIQFIIHATLAMNFSEVFPTQ